MDDKTLKSILLFFGALMLLVFVYFNFFFTPSQADYSVDLEKIKEITQKEKERRMELKKERDEKAREGMGEIKIWEPKEEKREFIAPEKRGTEETDVRSEPDASGTPNTLTLPTSPTVPDILDIPAAILEVPCFVEGKEVKEGESEVFYSKQEAPYGISCSFFSETRTCREGNLSGDPSYSFRSCIPAFSNKQPCSLSGFLVSEGLSHIFYSKPSVSSSESCLEYSSKRTCFGGVLGEPSSHEFLYCSEGEKNCSASGVVIESEKSRIFYSRPSVPTGYFCSNFSQRRTCSRGYLSGPSSYSYAECTEK